MGVRNILILFFSTLAVSLVILIIFFNLFFKNVDLSFDTHVPESAPKLENFINRGGNFKAGDTVHSTVNVPHDAQRQPGADFPTVGIGASDRTDTEPAAIEPPAIQAPPQEQQPQEAIGTQPANGSAAETTPRVAQPQQNTAPSPVPIPMADSTKSSTPSTSVGRQQ
jgi:hypothetical protein